MHDSARFQRANTAGLCERPGSRELSPHGQQARVPRRGFAVLAGVAVIVTSTYVLCAQQTAFSETFTPTHVAALNPCTVGCAQHPDPAAGSLPGPSTRPALVPPGVGEWQGQRIALRSIQDRHHVQEQENSCVPAAVKNLIHALTGKDIPEAAIREKLAAVADDGDHDFSRYGIDPVHALPVLEQFGVPSTARAGINLEELVQLTDGGRPLLIGISKPYLHRLMLDRVTSGAAGELEFHVRNSKTPSGLPGVLTRQEFEAAYNPSAIVIVPL